MAEGGGIEPLGRNAYPGFQDQLPTIQRHPLDKIGPPAGSRTQVFRLSGGCSTVELQENLNLAFKIDHLTFGYRQK